MSREIKFRAWDKRKLSEGTVITKHPFFFDLQMLSDGKIKLDEDHIIMQYTGLKDKDGKEIYEGDILRQPFNDDETTQTHIIFTFHWENGVYTDEGWYLADMDFSQIEIIGNIYENPELLKPNHPTRE